MTLNWVLAALTPGAPISLPNYLTPAGDLAWITSLRQRESSYDAIRFQCGAFLTLIKMKDPLYAWIFLPVNGTTHHLSRFFGGCLDTIILLNACFVSRLGRSPPEVIVGHVKVFQREQEVVEGLSGDFDQLVVVDDQVLQIDQARQVPGADRRQSVT